MCVWGLGVRLCCNTMEITGGGCKSFKEMKITSDNVNNFFEFLFVFLFTQIGG